MSNYHGVFWTCKYSCVHRGTQLSPAILSTLYYHIQTRLPSLWHLYVGGVSSCILRKALLGNAEATQQSYR